MQIICNHNVDLKGVIHCQVCGHEFPVSISDGCVQELGVSFSGAQSGRLNPYVPTVIKQDIEEAEKAHYASCNKSSVTMCRRAFQLALIDRGVVDAPLSKMMKDSVSLLSGDTYTMANTIKAYGDIGVHRREILESQKVELIISITVDILNELFPK
jgi:hypothetical protein